MATKQTIKIHPLADKLPRMPSRDYKDLLEDIKANGIKMKLLVLKDRKTLIDGRHRWYAAHDLGLTIPDNMFEVFKGSDDDIGREIISRNVFRRHLTDNQRAALVTLLRGEQLEKEAKARQADKSGSFGKGNGKANGKGSVAAHIAKEAKVSTHKAEQALKAKKAGMLEDVVSGKVSLQKAARKGGKSKRKPKKKEPVTLEDEVFKRWEKWLKYWPVTMHREVKKIVRGLAA